MCCGSTFVLTVNLQLSSSSIALQTKLTKPEVETSKLSVAWIGVMAIAYIAIYSD